MSYIKKEVKEGQRDRMDAQVDAVRNKLAKWADKVQVGGYYKTPDIERKEGDEWEDDGKKWTVKNGVKQTIRKLQGAVTPWWCPRCEKSLNGKLNEKFWRIRGACHDCVVAYEHKMRLAGVWDAYERRQLFANEKAWLRDVFVKHDEYIRHFRTPQLHFSDGRWEELATKKMFEERFEEIRKDMTFISQRIEQIEKDETHDTDEQQKLSEWERNNPWY